MCLLNNNNNNSNNNNDDDNNNNNNNNNIPVVMKYRARVRRGITNRLMARWGFSVLAGSLSSDGVTIKILVVRQPYTYQPFL